MILRSFYNGALSIASKHDFDDVFFASASTYANTLQILVNVTFKPQFHIC
jgi:hypothetical protein